MPRLPTVEEQPAGLVFVPDFLTASEEGQVLELLARMELHEVVMRGQASLRQVRHFGLGYHYESHELAQTEPWPTELEWLRERAAALIDVEPARFEQILVTRYPAGAGIGWHRDAPAFGSRVVGVSLASPCTMRFQRREPDVRRVWELALLPRSAYVIGGEARTKWQHTIPATKAGRWSVTFRTVRGFAHPTSPNRTASAGPLRARARPAPAVPDRR